jgi:hypothetical protein
VSAIPSEKPSVSLQQPAFSVAVAIALVACRLVLFIFIGGRYGYFRDELYFLDCARHLAPGYVDMAPLTAFYARFGLLLGGSIHAIRLLPVLAGAGLIVLTMQIVWQLGGGRFAQLFAGVCVLVAPAFVGMDVILTMNAFEPLCWMGCISVFLAIISRGDSRLWIWFGVLAGLGLENKHSTAFFGFAFVVALLLTEHRREFLKPWIWIAGLITLVIFAPNLIWQIQHHFPTLEDLENVRRSGKNVVLGPGAFVWQQILSFHPLLLPVWFAGLVWFLRERRWRVLGLTFVVFFVTMFLMHAKDYYLFPIYPILFAGGAVVIERALARWPESRRRWVQPALIIAVIAVNVPVDPLVLPILSPDQYIAYARALHLAPRKTEVEHDGPLPQLFGDQFGWRELVKEIADIYWALPPEVRARTGIFASNYGEAGALNLFGPAYKLPPPICAHQNHYFWGDHGFQGDTLIWLQWGRDSIGRMCNSVEQVGEHYHAYGMAEENRPIYLCRGLKKPLRELWPYLKHWN